MATGALKDHLDLHPEITDYNQVVTLITAWCSAKMGQRKLKAASSASSTVFTDVNALWWKTGKGNKTWNNNWNNFNWKGGKPTGKFGKKGTVKGKTTKGNWSGGSWNNTGQSGKGWYSGGKSTGKKGRRVKEKLAHGELLQKALARAKLHLVQTSASTVANLAIWQKTASRVLLQPWILATSSLNI